MSDALVGLIVALGLGVIVVRRRSVATALVAAQSLALGIGALSLASGARRTSWSRAWCS
jgi:hypothetical protein